MLYKLKNLVDAHFLWLYCVDELNKSCFIRPRHRRTFFTISSELNKRLVHSIKKSLIADMLTLNVPLDLELICFFLICRKPIDFSLLLDLKE